MLKVLSVIRQDEFVQYATIGKERMKMIQECVLLGFLFVLAWTDWKRQEISLIVVALSGCCGILLRRTAGDFQWEQIAGGMLVGAGLLLWALCTRESVGTGDALLFVSTGIYLGLWQNLLLLFLSSLCAAACGLILLLKKRCTKGGRIPFVPFVLAADVLMEVWIR